ncbi:isocitrate lyase/phosphoenolpyruvate mutase family protein [Halobaculum sp. CBA1158]|uniref:isocitrate lyase/PEP mutase family protein n=1 Tax=Halobaculum sp. CBA1158 TaxID=2904243 RepID=UPI001F3511C6|nr:isocitrate lyase/phosphoenolpyruvate mutase family protein [Halobaculum sp. CBA1158]UIP00547.1 isocitrate lyase/phosphoenolpyruvate mutase family protein [Halobaculum sp. CBA1158]
MDYDTQRDRARTFRALHEDSDGAFVLANAWDVASALMYERQGFAAVATSSAGVAASLGYPDGERVPREEMIAATRRIAESVALPVSADIEAGYGDAPDAVGETVARAIEAGAIGVNLEDGTGDPADPLTATDDHAAAISAARAAADESDVPAVVNARTDVFWAGVGDPSDRLDRAVARANAYVDAGGDCAFVPGVTDRETIAALADRIDAPLNVLGGPGAPPVPDMGDLGVARVSVGSGPMRATLAALDAIGAEVLESGTYDRMEEAVPYDELADLLAESVGRRDG